MTTLQDCVDLWAKHVFTRTENFKRLVLEGLFTQDELKKIKQPDAATCPGFSAESNLYTALEALITYETQTTETLLAAAKNKDQIDKLRLSLDQKDKELEAANKRIIELEGKLGSNSKGRNEHQNISSVQKHPDAITECDQKAYNELASVFSYADLDGWDNMLDEVLDCIIDGVDNYGERSQMPMYNIRVLQKAVRALSKSSSPLPIAKAVITDRIK
jgi:hypothetical protein